MVISKSKIILGMALALLMSGTAFAKGSDDTLDHEGKAAKAKQRIEEFKAKGGLIAPIRFISASGEGKRAGVAFFKDGKDGLHVRVRLRGLPPGEHGFHVHAGTSCAPAEQGGTMVAGLAAGGHFDPDNTGKHMGPDKAGHKGDLPVLKADAEGKVKTRFVVHGLYAKDIKGKALVVHAGGDNYADAPAPLGGGGARIACGIID